MSRMPRRPRQHQLETESRTAFQAALPSTWVYRDVNQDYGIDAEVEIFTDEGEATGLKFLVQLKATDSSTLGIRLPIAKCEYYHALIQPVLIVRYLSQDQSIYSRWFHNWDAYYESKTDKSIAFAFRDEHKWDADQIPIFITQQVQSYRDLHSSHLARPISLSIEISDDNVHGIETYRILSQLRESVSGVSSLIEFNYDAQLPNHIVIGSDKIAVTLSNSPGATVHTPGGFTGEVTDQSLVYDTMLCIGLAFDMHGHPSEGSELISHFWEHATIPYEDKVAFSLARCLARANQMQLAIQIAERYFLKTDTYFAAQVYILPFLMVHSQLSPIDREFGLQVLVRIADTLEAAGENTRSGTIHYNMANILRGMHRYAEAIHQYREACRLENHYENRAYFWSELAGVLFMCRRWRLSSDCYTRSIALEDDRRVKLLHADTLLFLGRYLEAENLFSSVLDISASPEDAEWELKRYAISWLREYCNLDEQHRMQSPVLEGFDPSDMEADDIREICQTALQHDALSGLAWFNLGGVHNQSEETVEAGMCFLLTALVQPRDLEAWANAIGMAMNNNDTKLFGHALVAGYQINGEEFLRAVAARMSGDKQEFLQLVTSTLGEILKEREGMLLRIHHGEGGWDELKKAES